MRSKQIVRHLPKAFGTQISRRVFSFAFCLSSFTFCFAQEVVTVLTSNPILARKYNEHIISKNPYLLSATFDTLNLPFLDDFSKEGVYPDNALWLDKDAFINRSYPIAPPTLGVATLDGVGPSGQPYNIHSGANSSLPADSLTSKPIHLNFLPSDSVYFSFFWQAQGRGNFPNISDSLLLQFKDPSITNDLIAWTTVWYKTGYTTIVTDTVFHLVMVPIKNTSFLKNGFQFRFRNWATISGNVDHWHIDYVFLDKNRSAGDTIFDDVAFVYNPSSLLKNYTAMPWEQYQPSEMKTNLSFFIRNNDTAVRNISFVDTIFNSAGGIESSYYGGNENVYPFIKSKYCCPLSPLFPNPPISSTPAGYTFPTLTQDTSFLLECVINTTPDKDRWNDTLRYRQKFYDYYAYDDGTVEGGYGLNVLGGKIAYKFTLNSTDTLVAVQMLFNWMASNVTTQRFRITLWSDAGGVPGNMIYQDSSVTPEFNYTAHSDWGNLTNDFHTYMLTSPKTLSGTFYVGWQQFTAETLNVGFDKNINSNNKMFYNVGSGWTPSVVPGSWMIRPVFRNTAAIAAVANNEVVLPQFNVFPNPTNGQFTVHCPQFTIGNNYNLDIYNMMGEIVFRQTVNRQQETINLDDPNGIYFLLITDGKGNTQAQKLILTK
ncbi:MAG: T9SS type A sorting domain-containing protein [Bacteroidetes bacterium]|nr:T9SS type A sorting domain-containing protein [Bacteroidota bacterium]